MFKFDRNYKNLAQVEAFLPEFTKLRDEIIAAGKYPYNDSFKGQIAGIVGEDEDTAIYLLQGLRRQMIQDAYVEQLLAEGYEVIESLDKFEEKRFAHIVLIPDGRMNGPQAEFREARLVGDENGKPVGVLPKGKRTRGSLVMGRKVYGAVA